MKNFLKNSKVKEVRKYYENISGVLSKGEGGLSSFRICYENNNSNINDKKEIINDDILFIVDEYKKLIPMNIKN